MARNRAGDDDDDHDEGDAVFDDEGEDEDEAETVRRARSEWTWGTAALAHWNEGLDPRDDDDDDDRMTPEQRAWCIKWVTVPPDEFEAMEPPWRSMKPRTSPCSYRAIGGPMKPAERWSARLWA